MNQFHDPTRTIYLLVNALLFSIGVFILNSPGVADLLGASISEGIGISLVATGIAGTVVYLHVRSEAQLKEVVGAVLSAGILNVFPARSARIREQYDQRLKTAKEIDVLALGLSSFRQDYFNEIEEWCKRARIRILVLDPDYPDTNHSYSKQRDIEEGNSENQIKNDVEMFITSFRELADKHPNNFKIRKYKALPAVNILRTDDELFWGPYIFEKSSRNMPTFIVKKGGYLFDSLKSHFDAIWSNDQFSEDI